MASIRDVAREAGVSPATVSRIINHDQHFAVKNSTRRKVMEVVRKLHYDPRTNQVNRTEIMMNQTNASIMVLCTLSSLQESNDLYFASIDEAIHSEAERVGLKIGNFTRFPNSKFSYSDVMKYSAIIIIGTFSEHFLNSIYHFNRNIVIVDEYRYLNKFDLVRNNYHDETKKALNSLYQQGHRNIAFIGGPINQMDRNGVIEEQFADIRTTAYLDWMRVHKLHPHYLSTDWSLHQGYLAMDELLNGHQKPTVIILASDQLAVGAYRAIQLHHLVIPEDISVMSFNDSQVASYLVPSLTSVHAPSSEMGCAAVRLVVDRLLNHRTISCQVILPSQLVTRESTMDI